MSIDTHRSGITEQDRTLSDLLETYRHLQSDPSIADERKQRAADRMKPVWTDLAKLQDPDGLINHISETVQREYHRRHDPSEGEEARGKPLCRCDRTRHVCEAKQGEVPSKIRTQDLQYIQKPSNRALAREYVQEHGGDIIIREAMESYRNLRADIYSELSAILAMMMGKESADGDGGGADAASGGGPGPSDGNHSDSEETTQSPRASADGGEELSPSEIVDRALASAVERRGADTLAKEATEGALNMMAVVSAYQDGDLSTEDLQAVADGERSLSELDVETEGDGGE